MICCAQLGALLVDRGDHRAHRHAEIDQHRLGQLQRGFERLGHRVGGAGPVELGGMVGIAGAGDDGEIGAPAAHPLDQPHRPGTGSSMVRISALAWPRLSWSSNSGRAASPKMSGKPSAPRRLDRVDVRIDRDIGLVVRGQHLGDQPPDPAEADDHRARLLAGRR